MSEIAKPEDRIKCPECRGEGEVKDDSGKFTYKLCSTCLGQGWVDKNV